MNSSLLRPFVVCACTLALLACDNSISQSIEHVTVSVNASRPEFVTGDTTTITVTVTNTDSKSVMITVPSCAFGFELKRAATEDAPAKKGCLGVDGSYLLSAGQTREFAQIWIGQEYGYAVMLSPGKYSMRGVVSTNRGEIVSEFTPIEILPR